MSLTQRRYFHRRLNDAHVVITVIDPIEILKISSFRQFISPSVHESYEWLAQLPNRNQLQQSLNPFSLESLWDAVLSADS